MTLKSLEILLYMLFIRPIILLLTYKQLKNNQEAVLSSMPHSSFSELRMSFKNYVGNILRQYLQHIVSEGKDRRDRSLRWYPIKIAVIFLQKVNVGGLIVYRKKIF